ncbi:hypothetical protein Q3G72_034025 [Acer saccharum]|nr:hypothetical protein Q3G72_034025 [Acer saccharum]
MEAAEELAIVAKAVDDKTMVVASTRRPRLHEIRSYLEFRSEIQRPKSVPYMYVRIYLRRYGGLYVPEADIAERVTAKPRNEQDEEQRLAYLEWPGVPVSHFCKNEA